MIETRRLFFGIAPDDETRSAIAAQLLASAPDGIPGKVVPPSNWHITLRFIGPVAGETADRVMFEAGQRLATPRFRLRLTGLGAFPRPSKATVLWIGVDRGLEGLSEVAASCEAAAVAAGLQPEDRPFHPHLTLARIRPHLDVSNMIAATTALHAEIDVAEVLLFESHLGPGGARYEIVERFSL